MLQLRLLGGAALEGPDGPITGPATHRHSIALLTLLALAPGRTLSRGKAVGYLWPESPEKAARNRLSTCVHRLRGVLGDEALVSLGGDLRLNDAAVDCDLWRFRRALQTGDPATAVREYGGPFLDGFWLRGSPEFERWLELERDRARRAYRDALEDLAATAWERGDVAGAARWWRERARDDPYDGRVTARLMEALVASRNRAEALRVAARHERLLAEELDAEPDVEIRRLAHALREREPADPSRSAGEADGGARSGEGPPSAERAGAAVGVTARFEPDPRALAVLPFEELGPGSAAASAFADGLHHDLLSRLGRMEGLTVISRTSVLRYREDRATIPEIARALGVGTVVEGGVQHAGGRVRLNVQLIDVRGDAHRWAETYDRELTTENLFDIQSELAEKITGSLRSELTPDERRRIMDWTPTDDLEAYRLHAHGRARLSERTEAGMRRAVEHFEKAIARDEDYALAWVGLADALTLLYEYGYEPAERTLPRADEAARRAVALDGGLAEAHASLGLLHDAKLEGPHAIRELERAVELQPGYAEAHNWLSWVGQLIGRPGPALESARRAVELNPLSPEALSNLSASLLINRQPEQALVEARRGRDVQPDWNTLPFYEALALFDLERYEEAGELLENLQVPWAGCGAQTTLALVHACTGNREEARRMQAELVEEEELFAAGLISVALGQIDEAFDSFERAKLAHWEALSVQYYYPRLLDPLREDPRYSRLLGRVRAIWGLEPDGSFPPER